MKFVDMSDQLYNSNYKLAFMETFEVDDVKRLQSLGFFRKTKKTEEKLNKDVYNMTYSELDQLLRDMGFRNSNIASRDISILNAYILWATIEGYSSNLSHRQFSVGRVELDKYIYKQLNTIYTFDELKEVFDKDNEIHALISWLMFEGIGGKKFEEIQELKVDDLFKNEDDVCYVRTNRGDIDIPIELYERLIAFNSVLNDSKSRNSFMESPYIFKAYKSKKEQYNTQVSKYIRNTIYRNLKEALQDKTVDTRTLVRSGCNYHAYKFMQESGEMKLTTDILRKISDRFNIYKNSTGAVYLGKVLDELHIDFMLEEYGEFEIDSVLKKKI